MRARLGVLFILALAAFPAAASAAPDETATLSKATPTFEWEGSGSGVTDTTGLSFFVPVDNPTAGCGAMAGHDCHYILLKVEDAGDLKIDLDGPDSQMIEEPSGFFGTLAAYPDIDLYLYPSDASGTKGEEAESLSYDGATWGSDESIIVPGLEPGYYLAEVEFYMAAEEAYTAKAVLSNFPAPPAVVVPAVEPPPAPAAPEPAAPAAAQPAAPAPQPAATPAKKKTSAKAKCLKKAKKIKNAKKRKAAVKRCAKKKG